jgi:hypothetical protein
VVHAIIVSAIESISGAPILLFADDRAFGFRQDPPGIVMHWCAILSMGAAALENRIMKYTKINLPSIMETQVLRDVQLEGVRASRRAIGPNGAVIHRNRSISGEFRSIGNIGA